MSAESILEECRVLAAEIAAEESVHSKLIDQARGSAGVSHMVAQQVSNMCRVDRFDLRRIHWLRRQYAQKMSDLDAAIRSEGVSIEAPSPLPTVKKSRK